MTIRQNYIDNFKVYLKMKGFGVAFDKPETGNSNTKYLANGIAMILKEDLHFTYTFKKQELNTKDHKLWDVFTYNKDNLTIKLITDFEQYSWTINTSNKLHNNTTLICYIMRNLIDFDPN